MSVQPVVWHTDVIILGSGGAALSAAVTSACLGLKVMVLERGPQLGGTSAISGGALWIPQTQQAIAGGFKDSRENARRYLQHVLGDSFRSEIIETFLDRGPEALGFLEYHTDLKYSVRALSPDYYPELPGATDCGRALEVGEYDGRRLGRYFELLRPPPRGMMGFGGMMVNRTDIYHFLNMRKSVRSCLHLARLTARFCQDRLTHSRGTRLVIGNAMIAALLKAALDRGVEFHLEAETRLFVTASDGSVRGILARLRDRGAVEIQARAGVILATGGLSRRSNVHEDRPDTPDDHLSMAAPYSDGSMIALAERQLSAKVGGSLRSNFYWAPMSQMTDEDGHHEVFPHIVTDRAKPGIIAVTEQGRRFVNEANSYHRFVEAMRAEHRRGVSRFYLIADQKSLNAYGLGLVRPRPGSHARFLFSGYLTRASSVASLAAKLGVDAAALEKTINDFNIDAADGIDRLFGKGNSSYNRAMGDANASNACLAPLQNPPYYAVRIMTGDLGSAKGLFTDANAQVQRTDGSLIPGLYAVGTDMNSAVGGAYPGPGIVLGTGLTFGYVAARAVAATLTSQEFGFCQNLGI
jgi:FAD binding domain